MRATGIGEGGAEASLPDDAGDAAFPIGPYPYYYALGRDVYGATSGGTSSAPLVTDIGTGDGRVLITGTLPLAWDSSQVYFVDTIVVGADSSAASYIYSLKSIPAAGGAESTLTTGTDAITSIGIDSSYVYYLRQAGTTDAPQGYVERIPRTGGTPQVLATTAANFYQLALDANYVYWTQFDPTPMDQSPLAGEVMKAPIAGGSPETLASGQPVPDLIAVDSTGVYWTTDGNITSPGCTRTDATLMKLAPASTVPITLASRLVIPYSFYVSNGNVYWATFGSYCSVVPPTGSGSIFELAGGSTASTTIAANLNDPEDLYVHAGTLYFVATTYTQSANATVITPGLNTLALH